MSSVTGDGIKEFFEAVDTSREEYERYVNKWYGCNVLSQAAREYFPELERARAAREKSLQDMKDESMVRFTGDLAVDKQRDPGLNEAWEEDVDEDGEDNIIDRCKWSSGNLLHWFTVLWCSRKPLAGRIH